MTMKQMMPSIIFGVIIILTASATLVFAGAQDSGYRFTMVMDTSERDPVEFEGVTINGNLTLKGATGGIETVTLLLNGDLYILTPSVKTARKIENPAPPELDGTGWVEWLIEPGRINPMLFAAVLGLEDDFSGTKTAGTRGQVEFTFAEGVLRSVVFPSGNGNNVVSYQYSPLEKDDSISSNDVGIPSDFLVID